MPRLVTATRYVAPLREGGSLPAIVEADDDGLYVAKFRGAGHGAKALVAELIAGEIGRALGLLVPDIVLVDLDAALAAGEPDAEIRELLQRSAGINVGLDFLPGALGFDPAAGFVPDADLGPVAERSRSDREVCAIKAGIACRHDGRHELRDRLDR
jgi:hypothetical protein